MSENKEKNLKNEPAVGLEYFKVKGRVFEAMHSSPSSLLQTRSAPNITAVAESTSTTTTLFPPINKNIPEPVFDFGTIEKSLPFEKPNIATFNVNSQDSLLAQDLLYILSGIRGSYITPVDSIKTGTDCDIFGPSFVISKDVHSSLRDLASQILPLASHYACIKNFAHKANFSNCGSVLQAFGAALQTLICDYQRMINQMELILDEGKLTLESMRLCVRPTLNVMTVLAKVVKDIVTHQCRGGRALTLLVQTINEQAGDEDAQKFLIGLTELAAVPYMKILENWVYKGVIHDPQGEFFVIENAETRRGDRPKTHAVEYWGKRYRVIHDRVPCFLVKFVDVILRSGKYLNVIRLCGNKLTLTGAMSLKYSFASKSYEKAIQDAYRFASKHLLDVIKKEHDLMGHLDSVRRYYLLYQGDFITQFMDACEPELIKFVNNVSPLSLKNCLDISQDLTLAQHDPHRNNISCKLLSYHLLTQLYKIYHREDCDMEVLRGWDCFTFVYESKWPVSLVLNHIVMSKYQMLFRRLFGFKHVERQLYKGWHEKLVLKNRPLHEAKKYDAALDLYRRMKNALRGLQYYMLIEVINPEWQIFVNNVEKAQNLDEILCLQDAFLELCVRSCLLTVEIETNRLLSEMTDICWKFSQFIQAESTQAGESFFESVKDFNNKFTEFFSAFFKEVNILAAKDPSERFHLLAYSLKKLKIVQM